MAGQAFRKFLLLFDGAFVERSATITVTKGDIILPEKSQGKVLQAIVIAVGSGSKGKKGGEIQPVSMRVGDKVLLPEYGGTKVVPDDKDYFLFRDGDILAGHGLLWGCGKCRQSILGSEISRGTWHLLALAKFSLSSSAALSATFPPTALKMEVYPTFKPLSLQTVKPMFAVLFDDDAYKSHCLNLVGPAGTNGCDIWTGDKQQQEQEKQCHVPVVMHTGNSSLGLPLARFAGGVPSEEKPYTKLTGAMLGSTGHHELTQNRNTKSFSIGIGQENRSQAAPLSGYAKGLQKKTEALCLHGDSHSSPGSKAKESLAGIRPSPTYQQAKSSPARLGCCPWVSPITKEKLDRDSGNFQKCGDDKGVPYKFLQDGLESAEDKGTILFCISRGEDKATVICTCLQPSAWLSLPFSRESAVLLMYNHSNTDLDMAVSPTGKKS
ncbi:PREDICTED: LOW QUALITY PROTEIN: uncharacterized protein LOC105539865 [Mandrillus leucophaeus]|uniref:LOW QUALITY PROTEIN: uncharacterized protein LOC105539865 n=1 Tax=Mandrillus leucophaeus TaxID=9568 RepID=UPI0005F46422|nr:PREDICTED: LOW QUALITY PROTEIN: uncharacterized protein LOC105539865 [Mandrillus leucophaeus]